MAEYTVELENAKSPRGGEIWEEMYDILDQRFDGHEDYVYIFKDYFFAKWGQYELFTKDTAEWLKRFDQKVMLLTKKYTERIEAYATEIGVLDGIVIKRSTDNYDLPVKGTEPIKPRVNPISGYPDRSYDATVTGGQNTADLRNNYINKIRDIWVEFVDEFEPLFYMIY